MQTPKATSGELPLRLHSVAITGLAESEQGWEFRLTPMNPGAITLAYSGEFRPPVDFDRRIFVVLESMSRIHSFSDPAGQASDTSRR